MESLRHDLRIALRLIVAYKGFSAAALLTLALGIGGTTAMFSIVYGVLLRPPPYAEPDRLMRLSEAHPGGTVPVFARGTLTDFTLDAWASAPKTIKDFATYSASVS
jgi:hypothetical protein